MPLEQHVLEWLSKLIWVKFLVSTFTLICSAFQTACNCCKTGLANLQVSFRHFYEKAFSNDWQSYRRGEGEILEKSPCFESDTNISKVSTVCSSLSCWKCTRLLNAGGTSENQFKIWLCTKPVCPVLGIGLHKRTCWWRYHCFGSSPMDGATDFVDWWTLSLYQWICAPSFFKWLTKLQARRGRNPGEEPMFWKRH